MSLGAGVDKGWLDARVFSFHPHESHFSAYPEELLKIPDDVRDEEAVLLPSMETAISFVMDGRPIFGEDVIVLGQGVIGLLTTSLLAMMPLSSLITVDKISSRRQMSLLLGADSSYPKRIVPGSPGKDRLWKEGRSDI